MSISDPHDAMPITVAMPSSGPNSRSMRSIPADEPVIVENVDREGCRPPAVRRHGSRDALGPLEFEIGDRDMGP